MMGAVIKNTIKQDKQERLELKELKTENSRESSIVEKELEELQLETIRAKTIKKKQKEENMSFN